MTLTEFMDSLEATTQTLRWRIMHNKHLGSLVLRGFGFGRDNLPYCPLVRVCEEKTGIGYPNGFFMNAALSLGMDGGVAKIVADAADDHYARVEHPFVSAAKHGIRNAMIQVTGAQKND